MELLEVYPLADIPKQHPLRKRSIHILITYHLDGRGREPIPPYELDALEGSIWILYYPHSNTPVGYADIRHLPAKKNQDEFLPLLTYFEIFREYRGLGYGRRMYHLLQERYEGMHIQLFSITNTSLGFWYHILGTSYFHQEMDRAISSRNRSVELSSLTLIERMELLQLYCHQNNYPVRLIAYLIKVERARIRGWDISLIKPSLIDYVQSRTGFLTTRTLYIPPDIPLIHHLPHKHPDRYILMNNDGSVTVKGATLPSTNRGVNKWNNRIVQQQREYETIPRGETVIYSYRDLENVYMISSLDKDMDITYIPNTDIPIIDNDGIITPRRKNQIQERRNGPISFYLACMESDSTEVQPVHPMYTRYVNTDYIVCHVESRGTLLIPESFPSPLDAIIWMLHTPSLCHKFKGYEDTKVETYDDRMYDLSPLPEKKQEDIEISDEEVVDISDEEEYDDIEY